MAKVIGLPREAASSRAKYHIKLKGYEGPFDVLLELIANQQVDILEVDLSKLTHDYIEFLKKQQEQEIEVTVEFLHVAAILLSVKASILTEEQDEKFDLPPTPEELLKNLKELSIFKRAAEMLSNLIEKRLLIYPSGYSQEGSGSRKIKRISLRALENAYLEVIKRNTPVLTGSHILTANLLINEAKEILKKAFSNCLEINLSEIMKKKDRRTAISLFFTILTLAQEGVIEIYQREVFSDISVRLVDSVGLRKWRV